jgi:hypothetical protein
LGLFSFATNILKAVPFVGDVLSAADSKKATSQANAATQLGITNAKSDLNSQLGTSMAALNPYATAGTDALSGIRALLGLNGGDAQGSAISSLQSSPLFQSLFRQGQDTILNNASATGGLRGGNVQSSLANFGSDTLASVIQQQLANLGQVSQQGFGATALGANLGANNAAQLAGLDTGSGQANAGAILGKQAIDNNLYSGLRQQVQQALTAAMGGGVSPFAGAAGANNMSKDALGGLGLPTLNTTPNINIALPRVSAGLPAF